MPSKSFFCLLKPVYFCWRQSTVSMVFSCALTEKVLLSLNERRRLKDFKDYIVKTRRFLWAEWNSRNNLFSLRKGFHVVYLFDCMKTQEQWTICQGAEIQRNKRYHTDKGKKFNGGCFRKWISTYHSSCYRIESRTTNNSDELWACIKKA